MRRSRLLAELSPNLVTFDVLLAWTVSRPIKSHSAHAQRQTLIRSHVLSLEVAAVGLLLLALVLLAAVLVVLAHIIAAHQRLLVVDGQISSIEAGNAVEGGFIETKRLVQEPRLELFDDIGCLRHHGVQEARRKWFLLRYLVFSRQVLDVIFVGLAELDALGSIGVCSR